MKYFEPSDGDCYYKDIVRKFPPELVQKALHHENYAERLVAEYREKGETACNLKKCSEIM